jgi:hypothetical protein
MKTDGSSAVLGQRDLRDAKRLDGRGNPAVHSRLQQHLPDLLDPAAVVERSADMDRERPEAG